jgi:hypothetical protein
MATYALPHFGDIDIDKLDEYYDASFELNGREVRLDMNSDETSIDIKRMDEIKAFIEKIADFDKQNKELIEQDYNDPDADTVKLYVSHHLKEVPGDEFGDRIDFNNKNISPELQFMKALQLVRVGLYPNDENNKFAIFDYSIGQDLTQYIVVIGTDNKGTPNHITMES